MSSGFSLLFTLVTLTVLISYVLLFSLITSRHQHPTKTKPLLFLTSNTDQPLSDPLTLDFFIICKFDQYLTATTQ